MASRDGRRGDGRGDRRGDNRGPPRGGKPGYGKPAFGEPGKGRPGRDGKPGFGKSRGGPGGPGDAKPKDSPGIKNPYVRFRPLRKPPMVRAATTLWDYPSQHYGDKEQGSQKYRGATPSWVIWQCLELWTKPGAVVVDPFCGSGTTLDVCADLGRTGKGFDIAPHRKDIVAADARKLPLEDRSADLVFFDPPYADNLTYSNDPKCIGKLKAEDGSWAKAMEQVIKESRRILKPDGYLCMFTSDILHARNNKKTFHPLGLQLATMAEDAKLEMVEHVACVRHGKALETGAGRMQADREGFLLRGFSHLVVFQRPR